MKKLISVSLSLLMILVFVCSALPVYATTGELSAADTAAIAEGKPFRLNDSANYYASFDEAVAAAATEGDTVYLLADATTASNNTLVVNKSLTLKGVGNVTLTNTADTNKYWITSVTANLSIENITIVIGCGGIVVGNNGNINMTNVIAKALRRPVLKLSNTEGTSTANITDSTLSFEGTGQKQGVITLEKTGNHVLNLAGNTTVTRTSGADTWGNDAKTHVSYNNSVICIFNSVGVGSSTVNVGSNVKIVGKHGAASTSALPDLPSIFVYMNDQGAGGGTLNVNLEAGSELAFDRINDGKNKNTYFNILGDGSKVNIVDKGCSFTANADAQIASVVLPTGTVDAEGGALLGYKLGENALTSNEYVNADATEKATFKAYFAEPAPDEDEDDPIVPSNPELSDEDNAAIAAGTPFRINDNTTTYYASFEAAFEAAAANDTIYVLANVTTTTQNIAINKNVTLKGINDEITITNGASATKKYWLNPITATINIEDLKLDISDGGIVVGIDGTLNMKNVYAESKFRPVIKISNASGTGTVTLDDSTVAMTSVSQQQNAIILEGNGEHILNLTGNTVVKRTTALSGWLPFDDGVIAIWYNAASSVNTINVGEGATILAQHGADGNGNTKVNMPSCIVYCNDGSAGTAAKPTTAAGKLTVNLAEGSMMEIDRANDGHNKNYFINLLGDAKNVTVNDSGCIYKAGKDALIAGVVLPTCVSDGNGGSALGFYMDGETMTFAEEYAKADATEAIEFTAFFFDADGFKLLDGASIRLEKPYGIRFTAEVSAELYETLKALDPDVEFGMILAPTRKVFNGFQPDEMADRDKAVITCEKWAVENVNGIYAYTGAIYLADDQLLANADEATFEAKISAIAYVKFTVNGETRIIYTTYDEAVNSRSILDVATAYYQDTVNGSTQNELINYIIAVCDDTDE